MTTNEPGYATGKICYLDIPCRDCSAAASFYADVFGWRVRDRGAGQFTFDDTVGQVSGMWTTGRPPSSEGGVVVHVMTGDIAATLARLRAGGGSVVVDVDPAASERWAHVTDPDGNLLGVYEQAGLGAQERAAAKVAAGGVAPVPEHLHRVTPRLAVTGALDAIGFYKRAFGAWESGERHCAPDGMLIHAELTIGDSVVMITEDDGYRALLATYWDDVDAAWERAVGAGATVVFPLADQFYGDRGGRLEDPFGQQWMLSSRIENLSAAEISARAAGGGN
ncbi:MAG: VOC family protein [Solirubrobacteraceae bacterium]